MVKRLSLAASLLAATLGSTAVAQSRYVAEPLVPRLSGLSLRCPCLSCLGHP